jgi:hypothetical protein
MAALAIIDYPSGEPVTLVTKIAGERITVDRLAVEEEWSKKRVTGVHADTDVSSAPGILHRITVSTVVAGETITVSDGPSNVPANILCVITLTAAIPPPLDFDAAFATKIVLKPSNDTIDMAVMYR